jgi:hypothetical protein
MFAYLMIRLLANVVVDHEPVFLHCSCRLPYHMDYFHMLRHSTCDSIECA